MVARYRVDTWIIRTGLGGSCPSGIHIRRCPLVDRDDASEGLLDMKTLQFAPPACYYVPQT
jgi:hypothetical protein